MNKFWSREINKYECIILHCETLNLCKSLFPMLLTQNQAFTKIKKKNGKKNVQLSLCFGFSNFKRKGGIAGKFHLS